jgi:hypothetical protein
MSKPSAKKAAFGRGRSEREYGRPRGNKQRRRLILILCEGSRTEPNYFSALKQAYREHLRDSGTQLTVIPGGEDRTSPTRLLNSAETEAGKNDIDTRAGDQVWCVFDTESSRPPDWLTRLLATPHKLRASLAISNPAFEYWYLLHFEQTDRPFMGVEELFDYLRKHIPRYDKNMAAFQCLGAQTTRALQNAEALRGQNGWSNCPNPSTSVDLLVRVITGATVAP